jgi:endonuclease/exonuclease/phosphatase family metal-dependent hydrolase
MTPATTIARPLFGTPRGITARAPAALILAEILTIGGGSVGAEPAGGWPAALRVASYNVQFVTPDLPLVRQVLREWPGHKPNVPARGQAIAERLACFDVVALQETINDQRRREIFDRLETAGRTCGKRSRLPSGRMFAFVEGPAVGDGSWLPLVGNELALATRLPIIATDSHIYRDAAEEEVLAAKGVLHARLARGPDDLIDVFVTHLQAGQEHGEVRRRQIGELAAFIRAAARTGVGPVLVLGDFNVRGAFVDRQDPGSDYNFLRRSLDAAVAPRRLADAWLATRAGDPDAASGTKPRMLPDGTLRPHEERIDYVFVAGADSLRPSSVAREFFPSEIIVDGRPLGHLSDHAALLAEVSWRRPHVPARVAASGP